MPKPLGASDFREILARKLKALNFDPLEELIGIYQSGNLTPREKVQVCETVMEYQYPKLKALDIQHKQEGGVQIIIRKFSEMEDGAPIKTIDMTPQGAPPMPASLQPTTALADIGDDEIDTQ